MKKIFYCTGIDGKINIEDVKKEYKLIKSLLEENGYEFTNEHDMIKNLPLTKENAELVVEVNLKCLKRADIVLINLSIPNHMYVGTVGEMIYAKIYQKKVIIIEGENNVGKHFWAVHHSNEIVKTIDEALVVLEAL